MRLFGLIITGFWIGFGWSWGTGNRIGEIVLPICAVFVSLIATAFELIKPIELEKAGEWDE